MRVYKNYLMDMDGVLVRGRTAIPGAGEFIAHLNAQNIPYLVLTNNPIYTPRDLAHRLQTTGLACAGRSHFHLRVGDGALLPSAVAHMEGVCDRRKRADGCHSPH